MRLNDALALATSKLGTVWLKKSQMFLQLVYVIENISQRPSSLTQCNQVAGAYITGAHR